MGATRGTRIALLVAVVWGLALLVGAFTMPVYSSDTSLVEENGQWVLLPVAIPLVATLVVAASLLRPRVGRGAMALAWIATGVVGVLNLLGLLTIGLFFLPVTLCLAVACSLDATQVRSGRA